MKLEDEFGLRVHKSTIDRAIDDFNYTLKRTLSIPERRNDPKKLGNQVFICILFPPFSLRAGWWQYLFLDEVGFNVSMRRKRGRSLSGERATMTVSTIRSRNISVCCAMSKSGAFFYKKQDKAFNTESFSLFLDDFLAKIELEGVSNAILVLDNVPFHRTQVIREKVEGRSCRLMFLPPYSPFLNPIENMFSQWKDGVKSGCPRSEEELLFLIDSGFLNISQEDCRGYYMNMFRYFPRCLNKVVIMD
jgi:transposase